MKLKLDEIIPAECEETARSLGHDVATVSSQSLNGEPDEKIWQIVQDEERLLVTQGKGFADLRIYPLGTHQGVLLLRPRRIHPSEIASFFRTVLRTVSLDELTGCIAVADPHGVRVRRPQRQGQ